MIDLTVAGLFWLSLAVVFSTMPILFLQLYKQNKQIAWLIFSVVSYIVVVYAYTNIMHISNIEVLYGIIKIFSLMMVVLGSILFFKAKLHRNVIVGLIFGILAIYFLSQKT
jgi:multidrug transporter EmrE-like cation transporter